MDRAPLRVANPPLRYAPELIEWIDTPPTAALEVYEEKARSIISTNDSPDIGFTHSVNPYRGCFHGCAYCYARRTHPYLDFGAGTDFERKLVAKVDAPARLREAFLKPAWRGAALMFSGVTDCYQPLEASYRLTRGCLEVCREFRNPVAIITKGALIRRDADILAELTRTASAEVFISIAFTDDATARKIEPWAPRPSVRFRAIEALVAAGVRVGVGVAPVIPGLNDARIPDILEQARSAGAGSAFMTLLRLPGEVHDIFLERLTGEFPTRAARVLSQLRDTRGGRDNDTVFGQRFSGAGARWEAIEWLFRSTCARLGVSEGEPRPPPGPSTFVRPEPQLSLWQRHSL